MIVDSTCVWRWKVLVMIEVWAWNTYYFHAKSRDKQRTGRTSPCNQNTGLVNNLGTTPSYSVENPSIGATVAYTAMKAIQIIILPGMAMT